MSELREKNTSPFFHIRWYEINPETGKKKQREKSTKILTTHKKEAEKYQTIFDAELLAKEQKDPGGLSRTTLATAWQHYKRNNLKKDKNTRYEHQHFYERFSQYFPPDTYCREINKINVENFIADIPLMKKLNGEKGLLSQNSQYNICKNTKKFMSFLFEYNYCAPFILNKDLLIGQRTSDITIFSDAHYEKIFSGLNAKSIMFQTAVYLLAYTGLRPTDLLQIYARDVDIKNKRYKYYSPKLDEYRYRYFHKEIIPVLKKRMSEISPDERLLNYSGSKTMGRAFRNYLKELKLTGNGYNSRTFRKTFTTYSFEQDIAPQTGAALQGHSAQTADKYYRKISNATQRKALDKIKIRKNKGKTRAK